MTRSKIRNRSCGCCEAWCHRRDDSSRGEGAVRPGITTYYLDHIGRDLTPPPPKEKKNPPPPPPKRNKSKKQKKKQHTPPPPPPPPPPPHPPPPVSARAARPTLQPAPGVPDPASHLPLGTKSRPRYRPQRTCATHSSRRVTFEFNAHRDNLTVPLAHRPLVAEAAEGHQEASSSYQAGAVEEKKKNPNNPNTKKTKTTNLATGIGDIAHAVQTYSRPTASASSAKCRPLGRDADARGTAARTSAEKLPHKNQPCITLAPSPWSTGLARGPHPHRG